MFSKKNFTKDLENNIYCRLQPSNVHGVGVFAIRDIPKDVDPFNGCRKVKWFKIPRREIMSNDKISDEVKKLAAELYAIKDGFLYFPSHSLNDVNISYFINHSDSPNLEVVREGEDFITKRYVEKGEELFADYRTYTDE